MVSLLSIIVPLLASDFEASEFKGMGTKASLITTSAFNLSHSLIVELSDMYLKVLVKLSYVMPRLTVRFLLTLVNAFMSAYVLGSGSLAFARKHTSCASFKSLIVGTTKYLSVRSYVFILILLLLLSDILSRCWQYLEYSSVNVCVSRRPSFKSDNLSFL